MLSHFARHELTLAWREWVGARTRRLKSRSRRGLYIFLVIVAALHVGVYIGIERFTDGPLPASILYTNPAARIITSLIVGSMFLPMVAQGLEAITKVLYERRDLDLIRASPAPMTELLALRCIFAAGSSSLNTAMLVALPVNVLIFRDGLAWAAAYGLVIAFAAFAGVCGILLALLLYRLFGPRRTRVISQVVAAVIGVGFMIGMQILPLLGMKSFSDMSSGAFLAFLKLVPAPDSMVWWPIRAGTGDLPILAMMLGVSLSLLTVTAFGVAPSFARSTLTIASQSETTGGRQRTGLHFRQRSVMRHMIAKELRLLIRDPWLLSQTLMQMLYLIPLIISIAWSSWQAGFSSRPLIGVLVMAAGQLAGGLAWLTLSAEDAPDLIASAPLPRRAILYAKLAATLIALVVIIGPILVMIAAFDPLSASVGLVGCAVSAAAATVIQYLDHRPSSRRGFRRRLATSQLATYAEFTGSIAWAFAFGLAVKGNTTAGLIAAAAAVTILIAAVAFRPRPQAA